MLYVWQMWSLHSKTAKQNLLENIATVSINCKDNCRIFSQIHKEIGGFVLHADFIADFSGVRLVSHIKLLGKCNFFVWLFSSSLYFVLWANISCKPIVKYKMQYIHCSIRCGFFSLWVPFF